MFTVRAATAITIETELHMGWGMSGCGKDTVKLDWLSLRMDIRANPYLPPHPQQTSQDVDANYSSNPLVINALDLLSRIPPSYENHT